MTTSRRKSQIRIVRGELEAPGDCGPSKKRKNEPEVLEIEVTLKDGSSPCRIEITSCKETVQVLVEPSCGRIIRSSGAMKIPYVLFDIVKDGKS